MNYENELAHHGVIGQKWGIRRYQNYDGSLTKSGMKRYNSSKEAYDKADEKFKTVKADYKSKNASKADYDNAKIARRKAERKMNKDYKHLKQDKLADQGKSLYANGKTITGNSQVTNVLSSVGTTALSLAAYNAKSGNSLGGKNVTKALAAIGGLSIATAAAKGATDAYQNKRLRAYYGHTSNY